VMNYPFLWPTLSFFGGDSLRDYHKPHLTFEPMGASDFSEEIERVFDLYDWEITLAQLNLLDSHDMGRALWILGEDRAALKLSVLFQMTVPGAPCIYYGDEIGMSAGDDPYCREAFPWDDRHAWDGDLLQHYHRATAMRHEYEVLRTGRFDVIHAHDHVIGTKRTFHDRLDTAICLFNADDEPAAVRLYADAIGIDAQKYTSAWPEEGAHLDLQGGSATVTLPPQSARVWVGE